MLMGPRDTDHDFICISYIIVVISSFRMVSRLLFAVVYSFSAYKLLRN